MVPVHWPTLTFGENSVDFNGNYSKKCVENLCSLSWQDRNLPPSEGGLALDRPGQISTLWLVLLRCCDRSPGLWLSPPSAHRFTEWREATEVSNDGHSPWGSCSAASLLSHGQTHRWIGQVFPKMAKGTSGEEQVLKKNDILELFDFMLCHRMKLCPGRNSDTAEIHPELGKQLSSLHTRNWEGRTQNTVWGK